MSSGDNNGLRLFDDTASAAGSFPTSLRGYERNAVDDYVRTLESSLVATRRHAQELQERVGALSDELAEANKVDPSDVDYANLGGRASDILRLAQEQARDLTERAGVEAERVKELARREADGIRQQASREGDVLKSSGVAEIDSLRVRLHEDVTAQVVQARAEAEALLAAARRQGEALQREAEHEAQVVRQTAYLDTEELRRVVDREVAEARQEITVARDEALAELRQVYEEAGEQTSALLHQATESHAEAAARLEADIAEAARIRAEALAEAEATRVAAVQDAEARVAAAQQEAATIRQRTQQEFSWRKQQLRRETELLSQRKQAVLGQLASLSALAQQTAHSFPELEDLDTDDTAEHPAAAVEQFGLADEPDRGAPHDIEHGPSEVTDDPGRPGDHAQLGERDGDQTAAEDDRTGEDLDRTDQRPVPSDAEDNDDTRLIDATPGPPSGPSYFDEPDLDGDATILVAVSDLPGELDQPAAADGDGSRSVG